MPQPVNEPRLVGSGARIRELDGLRAIAVLMVVSWHYIGLPAGGGSISGYGFLYHLFRTGRSGVDLFFVLSGFLITSILIEQRGADNYFQVFYARRALRILPVYALMILALILGRKFAGRPDVFGPQFPLWSYLLFLQNVEMARFNSYGADFLSATWSLAVEEQFYLFFPLIVALVPPRILPKVIIAVLILAPCLRLLSYWHTGQYMPSYVLSTDRADALAIGALIAWAFSNDTVRKWLVDHARTIRRVLFALIAASPLLGLTSGVDFPATMAYWGHTYLTLLYGAVVLTVLTHANSPALWPLRSRLAAAIATISYALYLVHEPILELMNAGGTIPTKWTLLALGISVAICSLSYFIIERPCLRFGRRTMAYRHKPAPPLDQGSPAHGPASA